MLIGRKSDLKIVRHHRSARESSFPPWRLEYSPSYRVSVGLGLARGSYRWTRVISPLRDFPQTPSQSGLRARDFPVGRLPRTPFKSDWHFPRPRFRSGRLGILRSCFPGSPSFSPSIILSPFSHIPALDRWPPEEGPRARSPPLRL